MKKRDPKEKIIDLINDRLAPGEAELVNECPGEAGTRGLRGSNKEVVF